MADEVLLLGVDGGGTRCRARLCNLDGTVLGEGLAGPANLRFGLQESAAAVHESAAQSLRHAGRDWREAKIVACLALAGASEPALLAEVRRRPTPFHRALFTTDAQAACVGAHAGEDGGIIIAGTGSIGWGRAGAREFRIGGWGFPVSDEGSGAWIGLEAVRRVLSAHDGLTPWTGFLEETFGRFNRDVHEIVRWMGTALPRDFAAIAPLAVAHAGEGDREACALMRRAGACIDRMAMRLGELGIARLALMGGLAAALEPYVTPATRRMLVAPKGDALSGAIHLARLEADRIAGATQRYAGHG